MTSVDVNGDSSRRPEMRERRYWYLSILPSSSREGGEDLTGKWFETDLDHHSSHLPDYLLNGGITLPRTEGLLSVMGGPGLPAARTLRVGEHICDGVQDLIVAPLLGEGRLPRQPRPRMPLKDVVGIIAQEIPSHAAVVHEDWRGTGHHVVRVDVGDREVVHRLQSGVRAHGLDRDRRAAERAQRLTDLDVGRVDPVLAVL